MNSTITISFVDHPVDGSVMLTFEDSAEMDEIAELRRAIAEIAEPEPLTFTTT